MHIISATESKEVRMDVLAVTQRLLDLYRPQLELYGSVDVVLPEMADATRVGVIARLTEVFEQRGYSAVEKPKQLDGTRILGVVVS